MESTEAKIKISKEVELPIDAVTQTFADIGKRGAGKTYLASMIAEQMLDLKAQIIVIDPIGNWWGLRVGEDGKSKGKDIFIIGGLHGDISIIPEAGKEIAKLLVDKQISVILDISEFRKNERKKFVTDFAEEFYHLKKSNKSPVHIFLEESQKFVPQKLIEKDEARMLGAWEDIVRLGRNYGIGCSLISQRPQSVNKEVLSQTECLCVLQITGLHERKALEEWIQEAGEDRKIIGYLPGLNQGEGYIWSPTWLKIFMKVTFNKKTTFDASKTPKVGQATKTAQISEMDIKNLKEMMKGIVEENKIKLKEKADYENKIKELNSEIRNLKSSKPREADPRALQTAHDRGYKEAEIAFSAENNGLKQDLNRMKKIIDGVAKMVGTDFNYSFPGKSIITKPIIKENYNKDHTSVEKAIGKATLRSSSQLDKSAENESKLLRAGAMKMLNWLSGIYPNNLSKQRLATLSGFSVKGGTFNTYISELKRNNWITGNGELTATEEGLNNANPEEMPSGEELLILWKSKFRDGAGKILQFVYDNQSTTKEEIGENTGFSIDGGTFNTYLSELRRNGLIEIRGQNVKISEEFF